MRGERVSESPPNLPAAPPLAALQNIRRRVIVDSVGPLVPSSEVMSACLTLSTLLEKGGKIERHTGMQFIREVAVSDLALITPGTVLESGRIEGTPRSLLEAMTCSLDCSRQEVRTLADFPDVLGRK